MRPQFSSEGWRASNIDVDFTVVNHRCAAICVRGLARSNIGRCPFNKITKQDSMCERDGWKRMVSTLGHLALTGLKLCTPFWARLGPV